MFAEVLSGIGDALDRARIPYMVIGGQAVLVHGEPRLTRDIDITLGVGATAVPRILHALEPLSLRPLPEDPAAFAVETMVLPLIHEPTDIRVDLVLSWTPYEAEAIGRASPVTVDGHRYRVVSPEDLVVLKMLAGRPRDLDDVRGIVVRRRDLDLDLVRRSLTRMRDLVDRDVVGAFDEMVVDVRDQHRPPDGIR